MLNCTPLGPGGFRSVGTVQPAVFFCFEPHGAQGTIESARGCRSMFYSAVICPSHTAGHFLDTEYAEKTQSHTETGLSTEKLCAPLCWTQCALCSKSSCPVVCALPAVREIRVDTVFEHSRPVGLVKIAYSPLPPSQRNGITLSLALPRLTI